MPGPMSNDLRKSIIEAKARGETNKKIAQEKAVSVSTVERAVLSRYFFKKVYLVYFGEIQKR